MEASTIVAIIAIIISIVSFVWNKFDDYKDKKTQEIKWTNKTSADLERDNKINEHNVEISSLKKENNEILKELTKMHVEGLAKIASAISEITNGNKDLVVKEVEESNTFFKNLDERRDIFAESKHEKSIVSEKAKRSSILNKTHELGQYSKKDQKKKKNS